mmetsp:Transcript_51089/g.141355  ORF Transcript_51089/g.141355 Transcript_51089/m.141355 type:complete len:290 (-) Transcript_51089:163-1032(-)
MEPPAAAWGTGAAGALEQIAAAGTATSAAEQTAVTDPAPAAASKPVAAPASAPGAASGAASGEDAALESELRAAEAAEPLDSALAAVQQHMGAVAKFAQVAAALTRMVEGRLSASGAAPFHAALRQAVVNGKGPKLAKLREPYSTLFDAVTSSRLDAFTPELAADVSMWAYSGATHGRLVKPERPLTPEALRPLLAQTIDVVERLVAEKRAAPRPVAAGGSLRGLVLGQLYEALTQLNGPSGPCKQHAWARDDLRRILELASQLGTACWSKEQHRAIERWASTLRARGV